MRPAALALASLEVAIAGRGAPLARLQNVGVHAEAHRAPRVAPVKACLCEDLGESFFLGLLLDAHRTRDDHGPYVFLDLVAFQDAGGGAQVLDAGVGARSEKYSVDLDLPDGCARFEIHVLERPLVAFVLGLGDLAVERDGLCRGRAPGDVGNQILRLDDDLFVELGALVGRELLPLLEGGVPVLAFGSVLPSLQVLEGRLVGGHEASPGPALDGHVAHGHATLHREPPDGLATVFDHVPNPASGTDAVQDAEHQVLGRNVRGELALDGDGHGLRPALGQRLGGEDVLDLAGSDAEGERAERAVGGGVGVSADDHEPRLGKSRLRPDNVHDALPDGTPLVELDAELLAVLPQGLHLLCRDFVFDGHPELRRRDVVVHRRQSQVGTAHAPAGEPEALESLRARHLVNQVQIHVQQVGFSLGAPYHVLVPDLLYQRLRTIHTHSSVSAIFGGPAAELVMLVPSSSRDNADLRAIMLRRT